jgi:hypothetical protein
MSMASAVDTIDETSLKPTEGVPRPVQYLGRGEIWTWVLCAIAFVLALVSVIRSRRVTSAHALSTAEREALLIELRSLLVTRPEGSAPI